jgi:hypothetical protein
MLFNEKAKIGSFFVKTSEKIQPDPVLNGEKIKKIKKRRKSLENAKFDFFLKDDRYEL